MKLRIVVRIQPRHWPDEIEACRECGLSLRGIAESIGADERSVRDWRRGRCAPSWEHGTALIELRARATLLRGFSRQM